MKLNTRVLGTTLLLSLFLQALLNGCADDRKGQAEQNAKKPAPPATVPSFSGKRSYDQLVAQTNFGPRNPGSTGHQRCLGYLQAEMKKYADAVNLQNFTANGYGGTVLNLTNVISSFNTSATTRLLLVAHWDTRPMADHDPDPKKRALPILGANDGASGVAVLLEIARVLKATPPRVGVDILFVDGEDYGKERDHDKYFLGAKYFAKHLPTGYAPHFAILVDMVGDKQLDIMKEPYSLENASDVVDLVWSKARDLGMTQFSDAVQNPVLDDHIPLNEAGIRTIDLIDFQYPDASNRYWHTMEDTPDKCSPESLEAVGTVLLHVIYGQN